MLKAFKNKLREGIERTVIKTKIQRDLERERRGEFSAQAPAPAPVIIGVAAPQAPAAAAGESPAQAPTPPTVESSPPVVDKGPGKRNWFKRDKNDPHSVRGPRFALAAQEHKRGSQPASAPTDGSLTGGFMDDATDTLGQIKRDVTNAMDPMVDLVTAAVTAAVDRTQESPAFKNNEYEEVSTVRDVRRRKPVPAQNMRERMRERAGEASALEAAARSAESLAFMGSTYGSAKTSGKVQPGGIPAEVSQAYAAKQRKKASRKVYAEDPESNLSPKPPTLLSRVRDFGNKLVRKTGQVTGQGDPNYDKIDDTAELREKDKEAQRLDNIQATSDDFYGSTRKLDDPVDPDSIPGYQNTKPLPKIWRQVRKERPVPSPSETNVGDQDLTQDHQNQPPSSPQTLEALIEAGVIERIVRPVPPPLRIDYYLHSPSGAVTQPAPAESEQSEQNEQTGRQAEQSDSEGDSEKARQRPKSRRAPKNKHDGRKKRQAERSDSEGDSEQETRQSANSRRAAKSEHIARRKREAEKSASESGSDNERREVIEDQASPSSIDENASRDRQEQAPRKQSGSDNESDKESPAAAEKGSTDSSRRPKSTIVDVLGLGDSGSQKDAEEIDPVFMAAQAAAELAKELQIKAKQKNISVGQRIKLKNPNEKSRFPSLFGRRKKDKPTTAASASQAPAKSATARIPHDVRTPTPVRNDFSAVLDTLVESEQPKAAQRGPTSSVLKKPAAASGKVEDFDPLAETSENSHPSSSSFATTLDLLSLTDAPGSKVNVVDQLLAAKQAVEKTKAQQKHIDLKTSLPEIKGDDSSSDLTAESSKAKPADELKAQKQQEEPTPTVDATSPTWKSSTEDEFAADHEEPGITPLQTPEPPTKPNTDFFADKSKGVAKEAQVEAPISAPLEPLEPFEADEAAHPAAQI